MVHFDISYLEFERFLFVLFRVGAIIFFLPLLGSGQIPARLKIMLVLVLSFIVFPMVASISMPQPRGLLELGVYLSSEVIIGLIIAFAARLIFASFQIAGSIVDFQMGFGFVNEIDPQNRPGISVAAKFQYLLAIMFYLALSAHHLAVYAIAESFQTINPASFTFSEAVMSLIMNLFTSTFAAAIKIAAPIMAVLFFTSVGMGLMARAVPQMNALIVGFPLQIGVGLLMMGLTLTFFNSVAGQHISQLPFWLIGFLKTL